MRRLPKHSWWLIGFVLFFLATTALGYHERYWVHDQLKNVIGGIAHNEKENGSVLTTAQIKRNLQPTLSATEVQVTDKLKDVYIRRLDVLKTGVQHAQVIVNPYKTSPLSALILVKTERATQATVEVVGDTKQTTITHQVSGYRKKHRIGVLGLYADRANTVIVHFTDHDGKQTSQTFAIKTGSLPSGIGVNQLASSQPEQMSLGKGNAQLTFAVGSQGTTYGLDANGEVRWYSTQPISHVFKTLADGRLLIVTKKQATDTKYNALRITDFYGKVYKQYNFDGRFPTRSNSEILADNTVIHHDAIELPNHDFLLTVDDGSSRYVEDTMIQIDRKTGKIKKVIDLKRILPKQAYQAYKATTRPDGKIDWFHQNSMYYDRQRNELLISGRNQSLIAAINYKTTQLKWILAAPQKIPQSYKKYLLHPTSSPFKYNGGQHAIRLIRTNKNTGASIELEYYDNNVAVTRGDWAQSKKYSMGTLVKINEEKKTVKRLWSYGKQRGQNNFTNIVGSSYDVGSDHSLINFGYADDGKRSEFIEVNRKNNQVVFDLNRTEFPSGDWTYRAQRMSLYPETD